MSKDKKEAKKYKASAAAKAELRKKEDLPFFSTRLIKLLVTILF